MSQYPPKPVGPYAPYGAPTYPQQQQNTLGLIGFILSLVGIFVCPLSLVGLILSVMGLKQEPKALAIAGTIIGAFITLVNLIVLLIYGAVIFACVGSAIGLGAAMKPTLDTHQSISTVRESVDEYYEANDAYPSTGTGQDMAAGHLDGWQKELRYSQLDGDYEIRSAGPDGQFNTPDDITDDDVTYPSDGNTTYGEFDFDEEMLDPGAKEQAAPTEEPTIDPSTAPPTEAAPPTNAGEATPGQEAQSSEPLSDDLVGDEPPSTGLNLDDTPAEAVESQP